MGELHIGVQPGQLRNLVSESKLERGCEYKLSSTVFISVSEGERDGGGVREEKREKETEE